jgi:hypothetical protein
MTMGKTIIAATFLIVMTVPAAPPASAQHCEVVHNQRECHWVASGHQRCGTRFFAGVTGRLGRPRRPTIRPPTSEHTDTMHSEEGWILLRASSSSASSFSSLPSSRAPSAKTKPKKKSKKATDVARRATDDARQLTQTATHTAKAIDRFIEGAASDARAAGRATHQR